MKNLTEVGRLAFRQEGSIWNCYWAPRQDSMEKAVFLGSLAMRFATVPEHKQAFMDLMRAVFSTASHDAFGVDPVWKTPRPAPEGERGGNA